MVAVRNFIIRKNLNEFKEKLEANQGISVFIDDEATEIQKTELGNKIKALKYVNTVTYESKEEALERMKETFNSTSVDFSTYEGEGNPFKASYVVYLTDLNKAEEIIEQIEKFDFVSSVVYNDSTYKKIEDIINKY